MILDRSEKKLLAMLSRMGGMDIEEIAETDPSALVRRHIEPGEEFTAEAAGQIAIDAQIDEDVTDQVAELLVKLHEVALAEDATLIEVNPLIVTSDREVVALDSKITIDNSALYRHEELAELRDRSAEDPQEQMAEEKGLTYVKLGGNIGILGNGAGLCMSTLDVVAQAGGKPANFLDAGGGSKADTIVDALEVITSDENVSAILFNIFGGITRCDEIAKGIIEASERIEIDVPLVVRLDGTNSEEGLGLLAEADAAGPARGEDDAWRGRARVVELAERLMAIIVDEETKLVISGLTGREGTSTGSQPRLRHRRRRGGHPGQGRPGRGGNPGLRQDRRGGLASAAPTPR